MQSDLGDGKKSNGLPNRDGSGWEEGFQQRTFGEERALREKAVFLVDSPLHGVFEPRLVKKEYGQTTIFELGHKRNPTSPISVLHSIQIR